MTTPKLGFEMEKIRLPLDTLLPVRTLKGPEKNLDRYRSIRDSIKAVGLIEPLVVHPQKGKSKQYLLLDGHLRLVALRELGETEADCIISCDDESYTYNIRINRIPPIQAHKMITRAVRDGVKPERIAAALNLPIANVRASMKLLDGLHEEVVELLKSKEIAPKALRFLKQVSFVRQIEIAELLVSANNFTAGYVEALVLGTSRDQVAQPDKPKARAGLTAEQIAKLEKEMESLERDLKSVEESYGENMLNLTCARGHIKKLLENVKVVRFLNGNHPDILREFETIAAADVA